MTGVQLKLGTAGYTTRNALFGLNMSGPEFAPWNGQTFPTAQNWIYVGTAGVNFCRLPIAWESLQPTLGGDLDATYLASIRTALVRAKAAGINVHVDIHNFGAYVNQAQWTTTVGYAGNAGAAGTGVNFMGDATLTPAMYADFLTKTTTALTGISNLVGIGAMNEPSVSVVHTNILTTPNYFSGANWFVSSSAVLTKQANGTNPIAGYGPSWTITSGSGFGAVNQGVTFAAVPYVISCYAKCAAATESLVFGISGTFSSAKTVTTSWQRFEFTRTPGAGLANAQIVVNNAAGGHTIEIANAQLELGSVATTYEPNPWFQYAQVGVSAIRAVDATIPIYVCGGAGFSQASSWTANNFEMYLLTGAGLVHEAHQYFDGAQGVGGGGLYSGTFTSYSVTTATGADCVAPYLTWCTDVSASGYLGEFGIPLSATDNNQQWLPTQTNFLASLLAANKRGTQWFFRSNGVQPGNTLGISTNGDLRLTQMVAVR